MCEAVLKKLVAGNPWDPMPREVSRLSLKEAALGLLWLALCRSILQRLSGGAAPRSAAGGFVLRSDPSPFSRVLRNFLLMGFSRTSSWVSYHSYRCNVLLITNTQETRSSYKHVFVFFMSNRCMPLVEHFWKLMMGQQLADNLLNVIFFLRCSIFSFLPSFPSPCTLIFL